jgi:hypothetical protein
MEVFMSLIHKQEMTEENLAAHRANGAHSHGAVTPEGKANSAAANLRHGLYAKARNGALTALGEDPEEYAGLMNCLENNLVEGLESELKERIGDTFWRMKRAARTQDGLALKRIKAAREAQKMTTMPIRLRAHENLERYEHLATALRRRGNGPTPAETQTFVKCFGDDPTEEMQEFFLLLKSLTKLEAGPERKAALRQARAQLADLHENYRLACVRLADQLDEMESPENLAAMTAPHNEESLYVQRLEDSSLRRLWRLMNMLFRVREGALTHGNMKNETTSGDVHENIGERAQEI